MHGERSRVLAGLGAEPWPEEGAPVPRVSPHSSDNWDACRSACLSPCFLICASGEQGPLGKAIRSNETQRRLQYAEHSLKGCARCTSSGKNLQITFATLAMQHTGRGQESRCTLTCRTHERTEIWGPGVCSETKFKSARAGQTAKETETVLSPQRACWGGEEGSSHTETCPPGEKGTEM